ncbi:MAG: [FeFe] hydrogenase H-cluster radical SAM maturase HydE [Ruminococcaceae bacterium]|nr:[FeFe] hydrogenase H-cluster radical SAM maturase HydE [Oscillospiraceae bacterium]
MKRLIEKLKKNNHLSKDEFTYLIENKTPEICEHIFKEADEVRKSIYGTDVYIRGLIEISNYCKNDCFYCGIRNSNSSLVRYRLSFDDIYSCCREGYSLGFRTFVLQGGEDSFFSDDVMEIIIRSIKESFPDCAVTLSLGERSRLSYERLYRAGADRYLLRHETAENCHYRRLHPVCLSLDERKKCLFDLKEIGYQVGTGFMVGSPFQTAQNLAEDMCFLTELKPHMVGIGPFLPHKKTPFKDYKAGDLELTLFMIALTRLTLPNALIPATTALSTLSSSGRIRAIMSGANVIMPNLSPKSLRKLYSLYDGKAHTDEEAKEGLSKLIKQVKAAGYEIVSSRGDYKEEG